MSHENDNLIFGNTTHTASPNNMASYENLEHFFHFDLDIQSRSIFIGTPQDYSNDGDGDHNISFKTASDVFKSVKILENINPTETIKVFLMTYGGNLNAGFAIYDVLKNSSCSVSITGCGVVMSAGAMILQAADAGHRIVYPNTQLMLHASKSGFSGHNVDMAKWAEAEKELATRMYKVFADRCGQLRDNSSRIDYWRKKMDHDWILFPKKALEYNIIDKII